MFWHRILFLILVFLTSQGFTPQSQLFKVSKGKVSFVSDAPLEIIKAESTEIKGIIDLAKKTFAFRIGPASFNGFNSGLQKEHFNENFMESAKYPVATFSGKIIDDYDLSSEKEQTVRAKGTLSIHGVDKERILKATIRRKGNNLELNSSFIFPLKDHNISIPRVVHQKIAEEIAVEVSATLTEGK